MSFLASSRTMSSVRQLSTAAAATKQRACPVSGLVQVTVAVSLGLSSMYLMSHTDALDSAYAPRSGLYYASLHRSYPHYRQHATAASSTLARSPLTPSTTARPPVAASNTALVGDCFKGQGIERELRLAGVIGRSLQQ